MYLQVTVSHDIHAFHLCDKLVIYHTFISCNKMEVIISNIISTIKQTVYLKMIPKRNENNLFKMKNFFDQLTELYSNRIVF